MENKFKKYTKGIKMTNVQIITNEFYTSSEVFNAFLNDDEAKLFRKKIKITLGLYHSTADGSLMGDFKIFGEDNYTILMTDIGNSDIELETAEEANNRLLKIVHN